MSGKLIYIGIFIIVAVVTSLISRKPTVILLSAIVISWFFNTIREKNEGFQGNDKHKTNRKKNEGFQGNDKDKSEEEMNNQNIDYKEFAKVQDEKSQEKTKSEAPKEGFGGFEGFEDQLQKSQEMINNLKSIGPVMKQMSGFISKMPPGILEQAMKRMSDKMSENAK
jgi:hypothetical protein